VSDAWLDVSRNSREAGGQGIRNRRAAVDRQSIVVRSRARNAVHDHAYGYPGG
jgi:hypothetical protein